MSDLEPLGPEEAVEMYLDHRRPDLSEKSYHNHKYRLNSFLEFCEERGITNLNNLTGRELHRFRTWRGEQVSPITLKTTLATLRVFLEFCATIDGVEQGLREKVVLPKVDSDDEARESMLDEDRAKAILDYIDRYEYASRDHVVIAILWHTGIRTGTLRALDVDDWDRSSSSLKIRHRPDTGTPLKNLGAAQRSIHVGDYYATVIQDYIDDRRNEITDSHGREPLITSTQGRLSSTSIRKAVYRWTRPCMIGGCPHNRDKATCEAMENHHASLCPSSVSPHDIRRGALTRMLRRGVPEEVVGDRSNVSNDVLDQHYDQRTERERMELRREYLQDYDGI